VERNSGSSRILLKIASFESTRLTIVSTNVRSKTSRKLSKLFVRARATSCASAAQLSSNWSKSSWSASPELEPEALVDHVDDPREVLGVELVLGAAAREDRDDLAAPLVERARPLERLRDPEMRQLDLAAEVDPLRRLTAGVPPAAKRATHFERLIVTCASPIQKALDLLLERPDLGVDLLERPRRDAAVEVPRERDLVAELRVSVVDPRVRDVGQHLGLQVLLDRRPVTARSRGARSGRARRSRARQGAGRSPGLAAPGRAPASLPVP